MGHLIPRCLLGPQEAALRKTRLVQMRLEDAELKLSVLHLAQGFSEQTVPAAFGLCQGNDAETSVYQSPLLGNFRKLSLRDSAQCSESAPHTQLFI